MKTSAGVLSLLVLVVAPSALAQVPVLLPEFNVNAPPGFGGFQAAEGICLGHDGRVVVTWTQYAAGEVFGRLFDRPDTPAGPSFPVSSEWEGRQFGSSIARDAEGRFVAVWNTELGGAWARRFDADGQPLGDNILISATGVEPHIASDASGNFVVAWGAPTNLGDVVARRYDSSGAPLGDPLAINSHTVGLQRVTGIAASSAGFVVTWTGPGANGFGLYGRKFDASGDPVTEDLEIGDPDYWRGHALNIGVAMTAAGEFVVVWVEEDDEAGTRVLGRRFGANGSPLDSAFPVSDATAMGSMPSVAADNSGNFLVTWRSAPPGEPDPYVGTISGRYYDIQGAPVSAEFTVNEDPAPEQHQPLPAVTADGSFVVAWTSGAYYEPQTVKARRSGVRSSPRIDLDPDSVVPQSSGSAGNGVLEPGESTLIQAAWLNDSSGEVALSGSATIFTGPPGAIYTLEDEAASYGSILPAETSSCTDDCYAVSVSAPEVRPAAHWDALLQETLSVGVPKAWILHVGESFPDVPTDDAFYEFVETLLHNGVTGGCAGGGYCPSDPVTRAQMAVFLLKAKFGSAHIPPPCTGSVFTDVPCTGGPFDPWIEELAELQITGGCGGGHYCPNDTVTRQQMAVFLLKTFEGSTYVPPACAGVFDDVTCTPGTGFSDWIEELATRGITGGCSMAPPLYCPTNPNNRGQMAVFLVKTFGLVLYGG